MAGDRSMRVVVRRRGSGANRDDHVGEKFILSPRSRSRPQRKGQRTLGFWIDVARHGGKVGRATRSSPVRVWPAVWLEVDVAARNGTSVRFFDLLHGQDRRCDLQRTVKRIRAMAVRSRLLSGMMVASVYYSGWEPSTDRGPGIPTGKGPSPRISGSRVGIWGRGEVCVSKGAGL